MGRNQTGQRASVSFNGLIRLFTAGLGHYHTGAAEGCWEVSVAPARRPLGFDWTNLISEVCARAGLSWLPIIPPVLQETEQLLSQNVDTWSQPKGGHACKQSTCPHRFCTYAHISILRKISWAVSWVMTLQQYVFPLEIKIWPHSLDKPLEQLNAKDTLELDKSNSGRGGLSNHPDWEDKILVFTNSILILTMS